MASFSEKRLKVSIWLTPDEIQHLDNQATLLNTKRGTLIRERAMQINSKSVQINSDPALYAKAVEACAQAIPGATRIQIEHATAKVIIAMSTTP